MTQDETWASDTLAVARGLLGRALLRHVAATLSPSSIAVAPLKGALFQIERPDLARPMADVDVLIDPAAAAPALDALHRDGFVDRGRGDGTRTLRHPDYPLDLDLHWRLFQRGLFALDARGVLERATGRSVDGHRLLIPSALDTYAHLVGHFVRGRHTADDRRHVADFARVPAIWSLDPSDCATHLRRTGLERAARYVLPIVVRDAGDAFAADTLAALGEDSWSAQVAHRAAIMLERNPGNAPLGAVACHLLNATLPRAASSLALHVAHGVFIRTMTGLARRVPSSE